MEPLGLTIGAMVVLIFLWLATAHHVRYLASRLEMAENDLHQLASLDGRVIELEGAEDSIRADLGGRIDDLLKAHTNHGHPHEHPLPSHEHPHAHDLISHEHDHVHEPDHVHGKAAHQHEYRFASRQERGGRSEVVYVCITCNDRTVWENPNPKLS